tara:strand:- start:17698 stop:18087 length:390 start_codon:yes stop_codon:yes gene_type:complete
MMKINKSKLGGATILVCDKVTAQVEKLLSLFTPTGATVVNLQEFDLVLAQVVDHCPDAILIDSKFNLSRNPTLVERIRNVNGEVPVFLLSDLEDYRASDIKSNFVEAILIKPINEEELLEAVALKLESL